MPQIRKNAGSYPGAGQLPQSSDNQNDRVGKRQLISMLPNREKNANPQPRSMHPPMLGHKPLMPHALPRLLRGYDLLE